MTKRIDDVEKIAKQLIKRVDSLDIDEAYKVGVFAGLLTQHLVAQRGGIEERPKQESGARSGPLSLPNRILALRDKKFFLHPKTDLEVHAEISKSYSCHKNRVEVALLRLVKKRHLRRTQKMENGEKVTAYAW